LGNTDKLVSIKQLCIDVDYIKFVYLISLFTHWKGATGEYSRNSDHSDSMLVTFCG